MMIQASLAADPCPRVDLLVSAIPNSAVYISVWRSTPGDRKVYVRGGNTVRTGGADTWSFTDYEAPLGYASVYTVQAVAAGVIIASAQVTAPVDGTQDVWLSDPLAPGVSAAVRIADGSLSSFTYTLDRSLVTVAGAALPVSVSGVRTAAGAFPVSLMADDVDTAGGVREVLTSADVVLLRVPAGRGVPLPPAAYMSADAVTETVVAERDQTGQVGASYWQFDLAADLVAMPNASVVVPPRTYATVLAESGTYANLVTLRPTYLDVLRGT